MTHLLSSLVVNFTAVVGQEKELWAFQEHRFPLHFQGLSWEVLIALGTPGTRIGHMEPRPGPQQGTHLEAIKGKGAFIRAKLLIRLTARPAPANPHVPSSDSLKFKVPPPCLHRIGLLCPEDTKPFPGAAAHLGSGGCGV
jgi:hypothetical protein